MRGAELPGFARRMQRVRSKEKAISEAGQIADEHGSLAPAVGLSAEENPAGSALADHLHSALEALPVAGGVSRARGSGWASLAEGQIATKDQISGISETVPDRLQEDGIAVSARTMREDQGVAARPRRLMEISADRDRT